MAQNLVINGVTYNGVDSLSIPKSGGGKAEYVDINAVATNSKAYEITLPKTYNWVLLTVLDADVLEHINDDSLVVSLVNLTPTLAEYYSGSIYIVTNKVIGNYNGTNLYGVSSRRYSATNTAFNGNTRPANNTDSSEDNATFGNFRIADGKYYVRPGDGYIDAGTYKLTFAW